MGHNLTHVSLALGYSSYRRRNFCCPSSARVSFFCCSAAAAAAPALYIGSTLVDVNHRISGIYSFCYVRMYVRLLDVTVEIVCFADCV